MTDTSSNMNQRNTSPECIKNTINYLFIRKDYSLANIHGIYLGMESGVPENTLSNTDYSNDGDYDDIFENDTTASNFDNDPRLEHQSNKSDKTDYDYEDKEVFE